jgi:molybdopterin molybdotransferase
MIPVEEARRLILERVVPLEMERTPLPGARGRILRTAARADLDSPPFDASAMDGYAARRVDLSRPLRVIGTAPAGTAFAGTVGAGECVRVFTGAPVPPGADCVVKQEDTARDGEMVRVTSTGPAPDFIRRRGENRRAGEVVIPAGTLLGPPELAALAAIGVTGPEVTRPPACAHLVTGNELVPPSRVPTGAQIRDSNSTLVQHLIESQGARFAGHARAKDDLVSAEQAMRAIADYDVLLISGGAGPGDHDLARPLLKSLGYEIQFEQLNLRPGRPLVFARKERQFAFALPGNPVSHWVTFQLFVAPLLQKLQTGIDPLVPRLSGRLAAGTRPPPPDTRRTFWPCRAALVHGGHELTLLPLASSGDSSGLVGANALLPLPANSLDPAQPVEFIPCP